MIAANNPYVVNPTTGAITGFSPPGERVLKYSKSCRASARSTTSPRGFRPSPAIRRAFRSPAPTTSTTPTSSPRAPTQAKPDPETTNSFDGGLRYRSSKIQAQVAGWYTLFNNRLGLGVRSRAQPTVFRNLGQVKKWGIDGSVAYSPIKAAHRLSCSVRGTSRRSRTTSRPASCLPARPATAVDPSVGHRPAQLRLHRRQPRSRFAEVQLRNVARRHASVRSTSASPPSAPARVTSSTTTSRCSRANRHHRADHRHGSTIRGLRPNGGRLTGWSTSMPA